MRRPRKKSDLEGLPNLGSTILARLAEVGVTSRAELEAVGPVEAYRRIRAKNRGRTVAVCYYLYSLQGALLDLHWDDLPAAMKTRLRGEADAARLWVMLSCV